MKHIFVILLLSITSVLVAQNSKLPGIWLMTRADMHGETRHPYQLFEFRDDGTFLAMDMKMGTWKYRQNDQHIFLKSRRNKDFNGEGRVQKLTADTLIMEKDGSTFYYRRFCPQKIAQANRASHLIGKWRLSGTEYPFAVLQFRAPDAFTLIRSGNGETSQESGTWLFDPKENAVIFIGFSHLLRGKIPLSHLNTTGFTLQLPGQTLKAQVLKNKSNAIERLTFSEDDFPEEAEPDQSRLPWRDFETMVDVLQKVASLQYDFGELVSDLNTLKQTHSILYKLKVDAEKPGVSFSYLTVSSNDTSQFAERYKGGLSERYNVFFPQKEPWPYRIKGVESLTVPAGTFACTVIEGMDGDKKIKYWMINDWPGVYAKIIKEEVAPFGKLTYHVQELMKIQSQPKKE